MTVWIYATTSGTAGQQAETEAPAAHVVETTGNRVLSTGNFLLNFFPNVPHPDQCAAGADGGGRERVRRRHHRSKELGALLPPLLRCARRRFHAGNGAGRNGSGQH